MRFSPKTDPDDVVIDFMDSRVADHSGLVAINTLADKYGDLGKRVHLLHLSSDCAALLLVERFDIVSYSDFSAK